MKAKAAEQKFLTEQAVRNYLGKTVQPASRDIVQPASSVYSAKTLAATTAHARVVVEILHALGINYWVQNKVAHELVGQMKKSRYEFSVGKNHRTDTPTGTERRAGFSAKVKRELAQINGWKYWNTVGPGSQIK